MRVWEALELLSEYEREQEIVIAWWDKEAVEDYIDYEFTLSDTQWSNIVAILGNNPAGFEYISETLTKLGTEYWQLTQEGKNR